MAEVLHINTSARKQVVNLTDRIGKEKGDRLLNLQLGFTPTGCRFTEEALC